MKNEEGGFGGRRRRGGGEEIRWESIEIRRQLDFFRLNFHPIFR